MIIWPWNQQFSNTAILTDNISKVTDKIFESYYITDNDVIDRIGSAEQLPEHAIKITNGKENEYKKS